MPRSMPYFAEGDAAHAADEYAAFGSAVGDPAAHLLAELVRLHNQGSAGDIPDRDAAATSVLGLYCRRIGDWVVFYAAAPLASRCVVTVLLVGRLNPHSFEALESEAEMRMRRL